MEQLNLETSNTDESEARQLPVNYPSMTTPGGGLSSNLPLDRDLKRMARDIDARHAAIISRMDQQQAQRRAEHDKRIRDLMPSARADLKYLPPIPTRAR